MKVVISNRSSSSRLNKGPMKYVFDVRRKVKLTGVPGRSGGELNFRLLENDDFRITETGDFRILE